MPEVLPGVLTPLRRRFFQCDSPALARRLLGCLLVHDSTEGRTVGRIVEAEAYDESEGASHSARGLTPRTRVMFGPAGFLYVYLSYGAHWCANIVAGPTGRGAAVLLRALEPVAGIEIMARRRRVELTADPRLLCSGPGRLTQAMAIVGAHNGADLCSGPIFVARASGSARGQRLRIESGPRIGITRATHLPWRFVIAGNRYV